MFFNVERLSYEGFANRVLPHEALHLSRSLISLFKNDWVRENLNTPKWWEDKRAVFVDMNDSNEEFFAEILERTTAIAMDGWFKVTGQKCVVDKNKTYAKGGQINDIKDLNKYLVHKQAGFNYHYIIGDYKFEINEFNDRKGWALNTYKKSKINDDWNLIDSYGYAGFTLRECKYMILQELKNN
jgi:hypothetical protein